MYCVYVIKSLKDNKLYTGMTNDRARRLKQHDRGSHAIPSTISRGPFALAYKEEIKNRGLNSFVIAAARAAIQVKSVKLPRLKYLI